MATFADFVQTELPKRPFTDADGEEGQILVRSNRPERARELVWSDPPTDVKPVISDIAISGHRFIFLDENQNARYASSDVQTHAAKILGMTLGASAIGDPIKVKRSGEIVEPSWNLIPDMAVYLGLNGMLTQVEPANPSVFSLIVGFPVTATKLFLSFREPIFF